MINCKEITKYNRSKEQLEQFFVFCWFSKAAKASHVEKKLNYLIEDVRDCLEDMGIEYKGFFNSLFLLSEWELLEEKLRDVKLGKYSSFLKAFPQFFLENLKEISLDELLNIHGVGQKIARMFLLHSRADQEYICLDTHLLKEANSRGIDVTLPYQDIESEFLEMLKTEGIKDFAKYDLKTWVSYTK